MELKVNYVTLAGTIAAFVLLAVALQAHNAIALASPAPVQAASTPHFPPKCFHSAGVIDAAAPNISKADYLPNATALVLVTISPGGSVEAAKIVKPSGSAGFDRATLVAAKASTYAPQVTACKAETGYYLFSARTGPPQP